MRIVYGGAEWWRYAFVGLLLLFVLVAAVMS